MFRAASLKRTLSAALRDLGSASAATRASAVADLTMHADDHRERVVPALERSLCDEAAEVRNAAAVALADVRGVEALPSLLVAVEDDDPTVRQMAIAALGEIGDSRARERLRRALSDARPEVRFQAIIAFSRVAPDECWDAVHGAFDDADANIRYIAIRCAEEAMMGGERTAPPSTLAQIGAMVRDPEVAVRVAAAIMLARSGDRRGEGVLADVVRQRLKTPEMEDEAAAVELAGELGIAGAREHLERRAFGVLGFGEDRFAWLALVSLARMGHARARARIVRELRSWWRDRRTMAVAAVARARIVEARPLIEAMRGDERRADGQAVATTLRELGELGDERRLAEGTPR